MRYSAFATNCFFCTQLCLRQGFDFDHEEIDNEEWKETYGSAKKIVGSIGDKLICDVCLAELKDLIGNRCQCSS